MIAVDSNILIYAHRNDSEWHAPAFAAVKRLALGQAAWLIPWPCVHEFLAIVTHARVYSPPTPLDVAVRQVEHWMDSPGLTIVGESGQHWPTLRDLTIRTGASGPRIHDVRVAAICMDQGVSELWSADRDFSRFPKLRVFNPLLTR